jgi:hypothetical protein
VTKSRHYFWRQPGRISKSLSRAIGRCPIVPDRLVQSRPGPSRGTVQNRCQEIQKDRVDETGSADRRKRRIPAFVRNSEKGHRSPGFDV